MVIMRFSDGLGVIGKTHGLPNNDLSVLNPLCSNRSASFISPFIFSHVRFPVKTAYFSFHVYYGHNVQLNKRKNSTVHRG